MRLQHCSKVLLRELPSLSAYYSCSLLTKRPCRGVVQASAAAGMVALGARSTGQAPSQEHQAMAP